MLVLLTGCTSWGPKVLPNNRQNFNTALLRSEDEQLLINIVRLRYGDRPYFLGINNVSLSSTYSLSATVTPSLTKNQTWGPLALYSSEMTRSFSATPGLTYNDNPTIIYNPLQGDKFTRQLLLPVDLETLYLLIESGWSVARVFRVAVNRIGDLPNAPESTRPDTKHAQIYKSFVEFAHYLRKLDREDQISIHGSKQKNHFYLEVHIKPEKLQTKAIRKLFTMLNIKKPREIIRFIESNEPEQIGQRITIDTRSFLGILYYVSKGVEVSDADKKKGLIVVPRYDNGEIFNWGDVTKGMMKIYSSTRFPENSSLMVYYRDRWFYIRDDDTNSKETFALLQQLFSLRAGDTGGKGPLLTLAV